MVPDNCNYIEYTILGGNNQGNIDIQSFTDHMKKIKSHKYFGRESKCYMFNDLVYENSFYNEVKVYSKRLIGVQEFCNKVAACYYTKEKQPYHAFPSTDKVNCVYYLKKLIFRLHNRLYLNFEVQYYPHTSSSVYKIYLNYNHDKSVDSDSVKQIIASTLQTLGYS